MTTELRIVAPLDAPIITCATSEEADELSPRMNTTRYYLRNETKSKEPKALGSQDSRATVKYAETYHRQH
jgi:hypothetical protein